MEGLDGVVNKPFPGAFPGGLRRLFPDGKRINPAGTHGVVERTALLLLLLLSQAWALSVTKEVTGPELIDVNETLAVSVDIVAFDYPAACEQTEDRLVCEFGQDVQGTVSITYGLRALGTGYGIIGGPRVYYGGGVKTLDFFRQYYVGKPRVELGLEAESTLLPGEDILVTVTMHNPGTRAIDHADLSLVHSGGSVEEPFSFSPGETVVKDYVLGQAGKRGLTDVTATVTWDNRSTSKELTVVFVSPSVSVTRSVEAKWRLEGKELVGYVLASYALSNNGTATGNVTFASGGSYSVAPGGSRVVERTYAEKAPAEKASVTDSRGVAYETYSFAEEAPEFRKGFFTLLYEFVGSEISPWLLIGIALGAVYFSTRFKNPNVKAGFLLLALVSGLLLYSHYAVGSWRPPLIGAP
jgi:hypothetical protein